MENSEKVLVLHGEHKGKIGILTGMYWGVGMCTVQFDDETEYGFKMKDIRKYE